MTPTKKWFAFMAVAAFISFISFIQVNSYWADQHHFNTGWIIIGVVFALAAIFCLTKVLKYGGGRSD